MDFIPLLNIKKGKTSKTSTSKLSLKSRKQLNQFQSQSLSQVNTESAKSEDQFLSFSQPAPESRRFGIHTDNLGENIPVLKSTCEENPSKEPDLQLLNDTSNPSPTSTSETSEQPSDNGTTETIDLTSTPEEVIEPQVVISSKSPPKLSVPAVKPSLEKLKNLKSLTKPLVTQPSESDLKSSLKTKNTQRKEKGKKLVKYKSLQHKVDESGSSNSSSSDDEVKSDIRLKFASKLQRFGKPEPKKFKFNTSPNLSPEKDSKCPLTFVAEEIPQQELETSANFSKSLVVLEETSNKLPPVDNDPQPHFEDSLQINVSDKTDITEITAKVESSESAYDDLPCPLCQKQVGKKRRAHMKSCAAKNNVSTAQLLRAIDLQEKQATERQALGLPVIIPPVNQRVLVKKKNTTRPSKDADVQLALALSRSLMEAQEHEEMRQARQLLGDEEAFGWQSSPSQVEMAVMAVVSEPQLPIAGSSNQLVLGPGANGVVQLQRSNTVARRGRNHSRNTGPPPLLLRTTREERERRITEKVAMLLVGGEGSGGDVTSETSSSGINANISLSSKLQKLKCQSPELWKLSGTPASDREAFYVEKISNFISPSKHQPGKLLKHISQIPGRLRTPTKSAAPDALDMSLCSFIDSTALLCKPRSSRSKGNPQIKTSPQKITPSKTGSYNLSRDWGSLLNCRTMSDVTVYVRGELELWAHSLVLFARCPAMLKDIAKEMSPGGKTVREQMLLWDEVSKETALAMLEFIYCDTTERAITLTEVQQDELTTLARRYKVQDLLRHLLMLSKVRSSLGLESDSNKKTSNLITPKSSPTKQKYDQPLVTSPASAQCSENTPQQSPLQRSSCNSRESIRSSQRSKSPDPFASSGEEERPDIDFLVSMMEKSQNQRVSQSSQESDTLRKISPNKTPCPKFIEKRKLSASLSPQERTLKKICKDFSKRSLLSDLENADVDMQSPTFQRSTSTTKIHALNSSQLLDMLENRSDRSPNSPNTSEIEILRSDNHNLESPIISDVWNDFDDYGCVPMAELYQSVKTPVVVRQKSPDTIITVSSATASPSSKSSQLSNSSLSRTLVATPNKKSNPLDDSLDVFEGANLSDLEKAALNAYSKVVSPPPTPQLLVKTPVSKKSMTQNNVTPMADYSIMDSPALKAELEKYGIRRLRRNQAQQILRHIYNELHPLVPATPVASSVPSPVSRRGTTRASRGQGRRGASCAVKRAGVRPYNNVHDISLSQPDPAQDDDSFEEILHTRNNFHDISLSQPLASHNSDNHSSSESDSSSSTDLSEDDSDDSFDADIAGGAQVLETAEQVADAMSRLIVSDPELHHRLLLYEPVWLAELKDLLKQNGKHCKPNLLLDYLDEHCITFRVPRPQRAARVRGGTQRRRNSPLKSGTASQRGTRGRRRRAATQLAP